MFGSDWPVCLLAADYDRVLGVLRDILGPHLNTTTEQAVFGGNAARFYKISGETTPQ
jgi:L-fuconolactonase